MEAAAIPTVAPPRGASRLWDERIQRWLPLIEKYAEIYDLDSNLVAAVMLVESDGKPSAISSSGAVGLMQVMPYHRTWFPNRPTKSQLLNPEYNVMMGCKILRQYIDMFDGDIRKGLGAYYAGSEAVLRGDPEPAWYAQMVLDAYETYTSGG